MIATELSQWLTDRFVAKDKLLEHFSQHGYFPGHLILSSLSICFAGADVEYGHVPVWSVCRH
jgi:hypothetical protein